MNLGYRSLLLSVLSITLILTLFNLVRFSASAHAEGATTPGSTLTGAIDGSSARPNLGVFVPGETVTLSFTATNASAETLTITTNDVHGDSVDSQTFTVPQAASAWTTTMRAYNGKLGFFRVYGQLSDGTTISPQFSLSPKNTDGSAAQAFITYAIVPNPSGRIKTLAQNQSFFAAWNTNPSLGSDIAALMGWRWMKDPDNWTWGIRAKHGILPTNAPSPFFNTTPANTFTVSEAANSPTWNIYTYPNLLMPHNYQSEPTSDVYSPAMNGTSMGNLTPTGSSDFSNFVSNVAQYWPQTYPNQAQNGGTYFEVTWEPQTPWGYTGSAANLVNVYQLASQAMHPTPTTNPSYLVTGPTLFIDTIAGLKYQYGLLKAGLAQYLDAFSSHPYMENDSNWDVFLEPEFSGQPSNIDSMKYLLTQLKGGPIPMIGSEQGYRTRQYVSGDPNEPTKFPSELSQAQRLVRSNLILLGEGWKQNLAFYQNDFYYYDAMQKTPTYQWDWGFFYNIAPPVMPGTVVNYATSVRQPDGTTLYTNATIKQPSGYEYQLNPVLSAPNGTLLNHFTATKVLPKPVVAAYAAMTYLLEGRQSVNNVNWLSDTTRGYVYESYTNTNDDLLALWDVSGQPVTLTLKNGRASTSVTVYDWMGNSQTVPVTNGQFSVTVGLEPIYIKGMAAWMWGSKRLFTNVALNQKVTTTGSTAWWDPITQANVEMSGSNAVDGYPWAMESRWLTPANSAAKVLQVTFSRPQTINEIRFFTGAYAPTKGLNVYNAYLPSYHLQTLNGNQWLDIVYRTNNTKAVVDETFASLSTTSVRLLVDPGDNQQFNLETQQYSNQISLYEFQAISPSTNPVITAHPMGQTVNATTALNVTAAATSAEGVNYQRRKSALATGTLLRVPMAN